MSIFGRRKNQVKNAIQRGRMNDVRSLSVFVGIECRKVRDINCTATFAST